MRNPYCRTMGNKKYVFNLENIELGQPHSSILDAFDVLASLTKQRSEPHADIVKCT